MDASSTMAFSHNKIDKLMEARRKSMSDDEEQKHALMMMGV